MSSAATDQWSSRFGFLMAAVGFAVGLGNIWRFPYVAGENGGGAFVLVYLLCAISIGAPILMAELLIGRRGRASPPLAFTAVATEQSSSPRWSVLGYLNLLTAFLIEVVYCVIAGWVLWYLYQALGNGFDGMDALAAQRNYEQMLANTPVMLFWTLLGLALTGFIVAAGIQRGIEKAVRWMMPMLFLLLVGLATYNYFAGGFAAAFDYLIGADFSKVDGALVLAATGQAFFSVGVAMAGMMAFGAYLPSHVSIGRSALIIIFADTLVALLAGLVIFPAVFLYGLDPAGGPGLIFQTLPVAFAQMPGGYVIGCLFFILLSVAAITSMVGLIEPVTAWVMEKFSLPRRTSACIVIASVAVLSIFSILTYNVWSEIRIFAKDLNGALDYLTNQIMLPLGGFLIAIFAGWFISKRALAEELQIAKSYRFEVWHLLIRYLVPLGVAAIFLSGVSS